MKTLVPALNGMDNNRPRTGFSLVELSLAIALYASAKMFIEVHTQNNLQLSIYRDNGRNMAAVMSAIDRRFTIDGFYSTENLAGSWVGAELKDMVQAELISSGHPDCGISNGWHPRLSRYESVALVPCAFPDLEVDADWYIRAQREMSGDGSYMSIWVIESYPLHAMSRDDLKRLRAFYDSFSFNLGAQSAGYISAEIIDLNKDRAVTSWGDCLGEPCSIRVSYVPNSLFEDLADPYAQVQNPTMNASLLFNSGSSNVACSTVSGEEISCGFSLGETLTLSSDSLTVESLTVEGIGCPSGGCGMTSHEGYTLQKYDDFAVSEIYVGAGDEPTFHLDGYGSGELFMRGDVEITGGLTVHGHSSLGDAITNSAYVSGKGSIGFADLSQGEVRMEGNYFRLKEATASIGSSCHAGEIAVTMNNEILTCAFGVFELKADFGGQSGLSRTSGDSGAIVAFNLDQCPQGWVSYSPINNNPQVAPSVGYYTGGARHPDRSADIKMTESMLPKHSHTSSAATRDYSQPQLAPGSSGGLYREDGSHITTTMSAGSPDPVPFNIRPPSYHMRYCQKQ